MVKTVYSASIQRLIGLWSVASVFLVVYFMVIPTLALIHIQDLMKGIARDRQNQLLVQDLQVAVQTDRARIATMLASGYFDAQTQRPDYQALLAPLLPVVTPEDASSLDQEVRAETERLQKLITMARNGRHQEAVDVLAAGADTSTLDGHLNGLAQNFESSIGAQNKSLKGFQPLLFVLMVVGLGLGLAIGWRVRTELNARLVPLVDCSSVAQRMGEGDFSVSVPPVRYRDEVGSVTEALGGCYRRLRDLSRRGQLLALEIATLSSRVLETSRHQSAAANVESQIAQEAADGLDELARGAGEMVKLSQEVIQRARVTEASTRSGLQAVQDTVRSVGTTLEQLQAVGDIAVALSENTRIIGDVVSMINDISDRSNIVAINASILAAASGMEAKSFAVVAREMKTLADQSKDASAGVRGILKNIERGIQTCAHLTEEAVNQGKSTGASTDDSDITIRRLAENIKTSLLSFQDTVNATQGQQEACGRVAQSLARLQNSCGDSVRGARDLETLADDLHRSANQLVSMMSIYKQSPEKADLDKKK